MLVRFMMLMLVVSVAAAFAMPEIPQKRALCSALLATALLAAAVFASSSAIASLARRLGLLLILILAVPAIYMAFQLAPIPVHGIGNPIWETASAALNAPLAERITVDVRTTVQAILHYNAVVALALLTAVVALDKQCASQLLYILVSVAAGVSGYAMLQQISGLDTRLLLVNSAVPAALGLLLSSGMMVGALEQSRRIKQRSGSALGWAAKLSLAVLAMLICLARILVGGQTSVVVAALLGMVIVLAVFAIRNWFYGIWGTAGVLATSAVLFLASFTIVPMRQDTDLTIALSRHQQAATERMLQDTAPTGLGAGAYPVVLPIHRDIGTAAARERPTAAAAIAIEMGRTFLCGLLIVTVLGAATLFRRSLLRGHDYVYASIGSGAAVSLAVLALIEDGILEYGASLLAAALFGLAFAQSRPSTASEVSYSRSSRSANGVNSRDPMNPPMRPSAFGNASVRLGLGFVAVVLIAQSAWLLTQRPHLGGLPIGQPAFSRTSIQALSSTPSKSLPAHGDLGAEIPATAQPKADETEDGTHLASLNAFADALHYSPLRGDLWLMLAAISKEQKSTGYDLIALLKLSYYTAPNDLALLPLRLTVVFGTGSVASEPELRELIKRDVKIALADQPALRPALLAAYQSAGADGKAFADNLISELDPSYLDSMRARTSRQGSR
ncbi:MULTISPECIES: hypothetical protein [unclassified Bradyrhizobium]|uniref:hypothetical protein n=1 Tax=unclassified Bradyrhizobium TaxID=2631580 RepID=UPI001FF954E0|nr:MULTISPECIES: hypothetical protein [unclassified Bradyrhizobium]MCK1535419.1 hypothetical protein [Bradyrhizobium sp. 176]MCK1558096.1 hypothetical protein [Bradyrhizobium sp. 171]